MDWHKVYKMVASALVHVCSTIFVLASVLLIFNIVKYGIFSSEAIKIAGWAFECLLGSLFATLMNNEN